MSDTPTPRRAPVDLAKSPTQVIFYAVLVASVYLLFAGHNRPGGGFVGALVAGGAIAARYVAGGMDEIRAAVRLRPWTILALGLLLAAGTAVAPVFAGHPLLDAAKWDADVPIFGEIGVSTVLVFESGVYLVVVGLVLMVFEAFGDDPPTDDDQPAPPPTGSLR